MSESFVKTGFVHKKSPKGFSGAHVWQKRWLVLSKDNLYYYKEKTATTPKGTIPVNKITGVYRVPSKKSPARFDVCYSNRAYAFKCETSDEASKWVDTIFQLLPAQQKAKAKQDEAKLAKAAELEEDGARKSTSTGVTSPSNKGSDDDVDENADSKATPSTPKVGGSSNSKTDAKAGASGSASASAAAAAQSKSPSVSSMDTPRGSIKLDREEEPLNLDNPEKRDPSAVSLRVRLFNGQRIAMYATPAMTVGMVKDKIWKAKAFKEKAADYALKLATGDLLFDDNIPFSRVQYMCYVFSESNPATTALDVYLAPRLDYVDPAKRAAAAKNKPSAYGVVNREGLVAQWVTNSGVGAWKDRYMVLQDDVLFLYNSRTNYQAKDPANYAIPVGALRVRPEEKKDKPNTLELAGGILKMDIIRLSFDTKDNLDKWVDWLALLHLRLCKLIVVSCAEELETRGLGMEGIFRLSGSQDEVLKLKEDFDARTYPNLKRADDHALTGVFKLCLRKMNNPVIPFKFYDEFIKTGDLEAKSDHLHAVKGILPKLPWANQTFLQYLMAFLYRVSTFNETNKMKPANLSIVIAPNILRPKEETMQATVGDAQNQLKTISVVIEKQAELWPEKMATWDKYVAAVRAGLAAGGHIDGKDVKMDVTAISAFQKEYSAASSSFIKSLATHELTSAWNAAFAAFEKADHNITPDVHARLSALMAEEEDFRSATLRRAASLAAQLADLTPSIKAPPPPEVAPASGPQVDSGSTAAAAAAAAASPNAAAPGAAPASATTTSANVEWCVALYDYAAQEPGELSFKEGDRIVITDRSDDWWKGKLGDVAGQFPSNYVQLEGAPAS